MALTISALTSFAKEFERINEQINAQMAQRVEALYSKTEAAEEDEKAIKERLSTEYVKQWIKHATATQRGQFRHIAKFTHPVASTKALLDKGSEYLRRRRK